MNNKAIEVIDIKKKYRLGEIGGGTLRGDLQSWWARVQKKEDPNLPIGTDASKFGDEFYALNSLSLEIYKGEAVGIIGHNGAGKSTLLKLLSRVTAPTEGEIRINGRIASMLEVGTGFHPELTGRENIYMNGAILGMSRKEVDSKIEEIIDFSECRQFIDTPVKRYSSGMYVKLAFAVAAHLDAEIMIMDEVLAVGDAKFQDKCLKKMSEEAKSGKTVLYVSHNMNTVRKLCSRCVVLEKGRIVFDGDTENAVKIYLNIKNELLCEYDLSDREREGNIDNLIHFCKAKVVSDKDMPYICKDTNSLALVVEFEAKKKKSDIAFRYTFRSIRGERIGMATTESNNRVEVGSNMVRLNLNISNLAPGEYSIDLIGYSYNDIGNQRLHDVVENAVLFKVIDDLDEQNGLEWNSNWWGYLKFDKIEVDCN